MRTIGHMRRSLDTWLMGAVYEAALYFVSPDIYMDQYVIYIQRRASVWTQERNWGVYIYICRTVRTIGLENSLNDIALGVVGCRMAPQCQSWNITRSPNRLIPNGILETHEVLC